MNSSGIISDNPNPKVFRGGGSPLSSSLFSRNNPHRIIHELCSKNDEYEPITEEEVFEVIRHLNDPEHPEYTLEELGVVKANQIKVHNNTRVIEVEFTPTVAYCSQANIIGLMLKVKLVRCLPERFKVDLRVEPGKHYDELNVNKRVNDKERITAAMENAHLAKVINEGIVHTDRWESIAELLKTLGR